MADQQNKYRWWLVLIPILFFLSGLFTLSDYGVNTDEPFHFMRGQAYLHMYLTGDRTYDDLEGFNEHIAANADRTASDESVAAEASGEQVVSNKRFSAYQQPTHTAEALIANDVGHPPLNGVLAAGFNKLFYQQLGWLGDIESYHLFEIFVATLGIALVMWWAYLEFGFVASLISGIALALHPMYLGESRFNIKDPIETVFFAATLFAFWRAITLGVKQKNEDRSFKWLLAGGLAFGAAIATKFNAFFVLPILGLWFVSLLIAALIKGDEAAELFADRRRNHQRTSASRSAGVSPLRQVLRTWFNPGALWGYLGAAVVTLVVVYAAWPNLWGDAIGYLERVFGFYFQLGTSEQYSPEFLTARGWNLFPLLDVILRAPLVTLVLAIVGVTGFIRYRKTAQFPTLLLWGIWLAIPILRVSLPEKALYGAHRQIMEYLPALALFAGVGAKMICDTAAKLFADQRRKNQQKSASRSTGVSPLAPSIIIGLIVALYIPILITLTRFHPNPQLFFNSLIGGFSGAHAVEFPFWNNTMNNAYVEGIDWLNANAESNARLSAVFALRSSLPPHRLRDDIELSNIYFSGPLEEGEYIIEILPIPNSSFIPKYINRFLDPVYTYEVDGVPLLAVWHNNGHHRTETRPSTEQPIEPTVSDDGKTLTLDFNSIHRFSRLELIPALEDTPLSNLGNRPCVPLTEGSLSISVDGQTWQRLENVPYVGVNRPVFQQHAFPDYLLAGERFRYVNIGPNEAACLLQPEAVRGWVYDDQVETGEIEE